MNGGNSLIFWWNQCVAKRHHGKTYHHIICMVWSTGQFWLLSCDLEPRNSIPPQMGRIFIALTLGYPVIKSLLHVFLKRVLLLHQEFLMVISVISAWSIMFLCKKISQWKATSKADIPQSRWESSKSRRKTGERICSVAKANQLLGTNAVSCWHDKLNSEIPL